jgi:putative membrane protein
METTVIRPVLTTLATDHAGWGWGPGPWFLVFPVLFWTAVIVALVLMRRRWRRHDGESTLADVFARGEISDAEYRARLAVLRELRR